MNTSSNLSDAFIDALTTVDEVQTMIKRLQCVEKRMLEENFNEPNTKISIEKEAEEVLSDDELVNFDNFVTNDKIWLATNEENSAVLDTIDTSFINESHFLNVKYRLLNIIKSSIYERSSESIPPPESSPPKSADGLKLKRNSSYIIKRDSALKTAPLLSDSGLDFEEGSPFQLLMSSNSKGGEEDSKYSTYKIKNLPRLMSLCRSNGEEEGQIEMRSGSRTTGLSDKIHVSPPPLSTSLNNTNTIASPEESSSSEDVGMRDFHSMAKMQEQSLIAISASRTFSRRSTRVISQGSSFDDEDGGERRAWSNDTYSLDHSNPPSSGTSSGVSSPHNAISYEDVQLASGGQLRLSLPNITVLKESKLSVPSGKFSGRKEDIKYRSDATITRNRARTRTLASPTPGISHVNIDEDRPPKSPHTARRDEPTKYLSRKGTFDYGERDNYETMTRVSGMAPMSYSPSTPTTSRTNGNNNSGRNSRNNGQTTSTNYGTYSARSGQTTSRLPVPGFKSRNISSAPSSASRAQNIH